MKIVFEDSELEEFVMSGESCIALPFEVLVPQNGEAVVTVYSKFEKEARLFADLFSDDPLGKDAVSFIKEHFTLPMKKAGYEYDGRSCQRLIHFTSDKAEIRSFDLPNVVMISTNAEFERYYNNATRDAELDDDDDLDVCFAVVEDDMILSFASVNDIRDGEYYEINVETSVESRNKGYAAAVVSALARYIISKGEKVSYKCRASNAASLRVAEKVGFSKAAESYSFVCYAKR